MEQNFQVVDIRSWLTCKGETKKFQEQQAKKR